MNLYISIFMVLNIGSQCSCKILTNDALISKMVSHFKHDNTIEHFRRHKHLKYKQPKSQDPEPQQTIDEENAKNQEISEKILASMQNVLCSNFPTVPCEMIITDDAINQLIHRSIQQITKTTTKPPTTSPYLHKSTTFPIDTEELSNFLKISDTGYFDEIDQKKMPKTKYQELKHKHTYNKPSKYKGKQNKDTKYNVLDISDIGLINKIVQNKVLNTKTQASKSENTETYNKPSKYKEKLNKDATHRFHNTKKLRKYYPQKIKYKDKRGFRKYPQKECMSEEFLETPIVAEKSSPQNPESFKVQPANAPAWKIDYNNINHGETIDDLFSLHKKLKGSEGHYMLDELAEGLEPLHRKEVMRPNVSINKKYMKQHNVMSGVF